MHLIDTRETKLLYFYIKMQKIFVKDFNLEHTLLCGQMFRVARAGDWYYIVARDRIFRVRQSVDCLEFQGVDEKFLVHDFALDEPYQTILKQIEKDSHIRKAIKKYHGLRIVRQDPWECLISFMCSSAANIPKIQLNIEKLSEYFGEKVRLHDFEWHTFPRPGKLDDYQQILMAKTGFRAIHIKKANDTIN